MRKRGDKSIPKKTVGVRIRVRVRAGVRVRNRDRVRDTKAWLASAVKSERHSWFRI